MLIDNPNLLPKVRSRILLDACSYMPCTLRISSFIPRHTCSGADTVIPAHMPVDGKGVNTKVSDLFVAAACLHCHDLIDRRDNRIAWIEENFPAALAERCLRGMAETQARWVAMGLINIDGMMLK